MKFGQAFGERALGFAFAHYLKAVRRFNRWTVEPGDIETDFARHHPFVLAMWHGQHLMIPFARAKSVRDVYAMVSRHRDAGAQAHALRWFKVEPIRGSGAHGGDRVREKGGARALLHLKRLIDGGASIGMTADVPKIARVAGAGIVTLGRLTQRPIVPVAVATSRRLDFKSWDRASVGLPFGHGAIVYGDPIYVPAKADAAAMETARLAVQAGLNIVHARAYALVGGRRSRRRPGRMIPLSLGAYRFATAAAAPFAGALLSLRLNRGKEDPDRIDERRGLSRQTRPGGPLVWLHGASVGETVSLLPLVERLTQAGLTALVTSGTLTSARLMTERLPPHALHQFAPLDSGRFMRSFLAHWRPGLALFAESEIWPNMILEAARAKVPLALVNARMSERSFRRWRRMSGAARALLGRFEATLAQTPDDSQRLTALGSRHAPVVGNLKFDAPPPPAAAQELAELSGLVAGRRLWIAASTHPGEERIAAETHRRLAVEFPDLLTLIAPRHPERGPAVAAEIAALGLACRRRSEGARPERDVAIYICDTMGELGLFYRLAGVAFLGKSLTGGGGQNPIEPAKLGAALLHGPHVGNFADVYAPLDAEDGAVLVNDADELGEALAQLFRNPSRLRDHARAAARVVERGAGAVERTLAALGPQFAALRP